MLNSSSLFSLIRLRIAQVTLAVITILSCFSAAAQFAQELPTVTLKQALKRDYFPIRELTFQILRAYPPTQYYYIGIGRSPTPVMAMIQAILGDEAGRNLPLSDMRFMAPADPAIIKKAQEWGGRFSPYRSEAEEQVKLEVYTPENVAKLREHLSHFLPASPTEIGSRKILFIDWADQGRTVRNFSREFAQMMDARPSERRLDYTVLALTWGNEMQEQLQKEGIDALVVFDSAVPIFDMRTHRELAEYDQYSVQYMSDKVMQPVTLQIKQDRHNSRNISYPDDDKRWVRQAKRERQKQYENLASYEDLKAGYRNRAIRDSRVNSFLSLMQAGFPSRLQRLQNFCESLLAWGHLKHSF